MKTEPTKYCIIFGSPRKNGNTAAVLKCFTEQLKEAGEEIQIFDVYEKQIGGCRACLACQSDLGKITCSLDDDMQPILRAVEEADALIIAAPVYIWSLPAPVKAVVDRLVYAGCKYYGGDPHGPSLFEGKKFAVITTCGYPIEKGADLLEEQMKRYCKHTKMTFLDILALRQRNLKEPFWDEEKAAETKVFAEKIRISCEREQEKK